MLPNTGYSSGLFALQTKLFPITTFANNSQSAPRPSASTHKKSNFNSNSSIRPIACVRRPEAFPAERVIALADYPTEDVCGSVYTKFCYFVLAQLPKEITYHDKIVSQTDFLLIWRGHGGANSTISADYFNFQPR